MYRHILAPIDCTDEARREAEELAYYLGPMHATRVTLAATITPSPDPAIRAAKVRHAEGALATIASILGGHGIYTRRRVVEGADTARAVAAESQDRDERYDLIVLGRHHTCPEIDDAVYMGSAADNIAKNAKIPVIILPCPSTSARMYEGA